MSRYMEFRGTIVLRNLEKDKLSGFKGQNSDIWVCGFPRSGTTLLQEIVYLVRTRDFNKAKTTPQPIRVQFIDAPDVLTPYPSGVESCETMETPRMIKSHLHYFLLPDDIRSGEGKIIYVARHPAPTAISLFGLMKYYRSPEATNLRDFVELFLQDKVYGCPWWLHVQQYWTHSEDKHVLFLQYEDIVKDKRGVIHKLAEFLDQTLSEDDVDKIVEHTNIENMRGNDMVNFTFTEKHLNMDKTRQFINKGSIDEWKTTLPGDLIQRFADMLHTRFGQSTLTFG